MANTKSNGAERASDTEQNTDRTNGAAAIEPVPLDEEEVRTTAYFLWEQDGRPEGQNDHYWWAALEKIARQKSSDALLTSGESSADR